MKHFDDINDDEIRLVNRRREPRKPWYGRWWFGVVMALLLVLLIVWAILRYATPKTPVSDSKEEESTAVVPTTVPSEPASVLLSDTIINDVPLHLYTPVNVVSELCIGMPDTSDPALMLAFQAADIRADNHQIVGAFVLKGELLSKGVAKKGFCAIIDGKLHLGMAESTSLFEEAIEKDGYFFRQYPLVSNGRMVENKPKGKAVRHALCEKDGRVVVVCSDARESFHDFAQALVDMGIQHALYLTGGSSCVFCRQADGQFEQEGNPYEWTPEANVNFIVWRNIQ